jgi:hypothetical protein
MRAPITAVVVMLLVAAATTESRAQVPPSLPATADVETIRKHIQSDVPSEQAWGAWLAGQTQRTELIPELVTLGSGRLPTKDWASAALIDVVLDALVQLRAGPDASWSMQFFDAWPAQSLLLLSRAGQDANATLVDLVRRQTGYRWLAAANLGVMRKAPGLAAVLLAGVAINADLIFTNSPNQGFGVGDGADVSGADGMRPGVQGFPPSIHYYLTGHPQAGSVVLATGPATVYYVREVFPPGQQHPTTWLDMSAPTLQHRLDYIAALRGRQFGGMALRARESKTIVWKAGMNIDREAAAYRAELTQRFDGLVRILVQENLLTGDEAKALPAPTINVTVQDKR